jgi:hypothetical protein
MPVAASQAIRVACAPTILVERTVRRLHLAGKRIG